MTTPITIGSKDFIDLVWGNTIPPYTKISMVGIWDNIKGFNIKLVLISYQSQYKAHPRFILISVARAVGPSVNSL
jgi:hypothetical protein